MLAKTMGNIIFDQIKNTIEYTSYSPVMSIQNMGKAYDSCTKIQSPLIFHLSKGQN
jgi:hypothetical protein